MRNPYDIRHVVPIVFFSVVLLASGCEQRTPADDRSGTATSGAQAAADSTVVPPGRPDPAGDAFPDGILRAYVWACEDGRTLTMRNLLPEQAIEIDLGAGPQRLVQTVSASGVRYAAADGASVFWTKGATATFERRGAQPLQCQERRAESLREDARLRGVRYRAVGNEPGWVLEIGPGDRLDWTTSYGQERHLFAGAIETAAGTGTDRTYAATNDAGDAIAVTVREEPCTDDAGIAYSRSATVEFGGGTLRGCAVRLD
jgi:uncharacterized membrane protein